MSSEILFSSVLFDRYDPDATLPAKFNRLLDRLDMGELVRGKTVAIKMHLGRNIGYSTIHPIYVKALVDKLKALNPALLYITDQETAGASNRGYTQEHLGVPVVDACGATERYFYEQDVAFKSFRRLDVAGHIRDADVMIDLSHVKGHGVCGFGGAVKNIAMGCVTTRTRQELHGLEGGLAWDKDLCTRCEACITNCNHYANAFTEDGDYEVNYHHCTFCQHCVRVCPTGAIQSTGNQYEDFQIGMALATKGVLDHFKPNHVVYINFLTHITIMCDCWGFTTPAVVPDIGVLAGYDVVAIERASLDMIKAENVLPAGLLKGTELDGKGHLFEQIHHKSPYIQLDRLEELGCGTQNYTITEVD
jgi:uncharacterized Fe-S center protein